MPREIAQSDGSQGSLQSVDKSSTCCIKPEPGGQNDKQRPFTFAGPHVKPVVRVCRKNRLKDSWH